MPIPIVAIVAVAWAAYSELKKQSKKGKRK